MHQNINRLTRGLLAGAALAVSTAHAGDALPIDASRIELGSSRFQLLQAGEARGEMFLSLERQEDQLVLHEGTTMLPDVRESMTAVLDGSSYAPRSLVLDADFSRTILDVELGWQGDTVSGTYRIKRPGELAKSDRPLEQELPPNTLLRASLFALAGGLPLAEGAEFSINWFASLSGAAQPVRLVVDGRQQVQVPAGSFDTWALHIHAQPENILYITAGESPRLVRIDVIGQDMVFERLPEVPTPDVP